jgi:ribA/ribD-fused uncharacterized protein
MIQCDIEINNEHYNSVENYYQSMKTDDIELRELIKNSTPHQSKKVAQKIKIRSDWNEVKFFIMFQALIKKFSHEPFKTQLLNTGDSVIIEWNNWGDTTWGVDCDTYTGHNILGKQLMIVRDILKYNNEMKSIKN